jgi:uncharacterized protein YjiS (DUF1127 family)
MTGPATTDLSPIQPPRGVAARLAERFRWWRQRRRWIGEMANAATLGRPGEMLDDVGITRAELDFLIKAPADAGRQFETLAAAEQVDLRQLRPEVLREAMWTCARCECRAPCERWLRTGIWNYSGDPRCPNAALLRH